MTLPDATPLDPDEAEGLIPTHIRTQAELNAWEQANILRAERWAFAIRRTEPPSVDGLLTAHQEMFGETWTWAGTVRTTGKSVGVAVERIRPDLQDLIDDVNYWIAHGTYPADEIAVRFHHRLTRIHPFPNGNGRHARLVTDILLVSLDRPSFSWGGADLHNRGGVRDRYLAALRAADGGDLAALRTFSRT